MRALLALAIALLAAAAPAHAQSKSYAPDQRFDPTQDVGLDQRLGERLPLQAVFRDEAGRAVRLGDYFGDKPVVVALVYYECPMLCNLILNGLVRVLRALSLDVGEDFEVVTVSIDARETPELARAKKDSYIETYSAGGRGGSPEAGWHFLVGDQASIDELAEAVGFRYVWDEDNEQFAHASGIMVATPEGVLSHYFYGVEYPTRDLRLGIVQASDGEVGSLVDQVLLLCLHYDPTTGRYGTAIVAALRIAGLLTVGALVGGVIWMMRGERRARTAAAEGAG